MVMYTATTRLHCVTTTDVQGMPVNVRSVLLDGNLVLFGLAGSLDGSADAVRSPTDSASAQAVRIRKEGFISVSS